MRQHLSDFLELYATAFCLVVVLAIPRLFGPSRFWQAAAVAGLIVIVGHGLFFWAVSRRQQRRYATKIAEVRRMLKECVNNDLTVVTAASTSPLIDARHPDFPAVRAHILEAAQQISRTLDLLSPESLKSWKTRYRR